MFLTMAYDIRIGGWRVKALDSVAVKRSIDTLSDTAAIYLPGTCCNKALQVEDKIHVGDPVLIRLGYGDSPQTEFEGYVDSIGTDDSRIAIRCIDGLYNFKRTQLANRQYANISVDELLAGIVSQVNAAEGTSYNFSCDYDTTYDKYTILNATGYDVLKTLQDELKANIYFEGSTLHLHPPYEEVKGDEPVRFDFARNIEQSELKYVRAADRKIEVEVEYRLPNGKMDKKTFGTSGGEKKTLRSPAENAEKAMELARREYSLWVYDGYEGSFTGWLIPYVEPTCKVSLHDGQYPGKDGTYYVLGTEVSFGADGGKRKISLGRRLS